MVDLTKQEIISGCKRGERQFQKLLVANYSPLLLSVSRRYTPRHMDAEDVLQDAFIKIFGAIRRFDPEKGSLEGWMRKIVVNTALKLLDKKCFTHERPIEDDIDVPVLPGVYDHMEAEEVMALVNDLPPGYRQVFNLYVVEEYNHKEIAELLEIEVATSRSNLSRAKALLRKKIQVENKWLKIS